MLVFIDKGSSNTTPWLVIASDERYYLAHTGTAFMKVVHKVQIPNLQRQVSTNLLNQALKRAKPALGLFFLVLVFWDVRNEFNEWIIEDSRRYLKVKNWASPNQLCIRVWMTDSYLILSTNRISLNHPKSIVLSPFHQFSLFKLLWIGEDCKCPISISSLVVFPGWFWRHLFREWLVPRDVWRLAVGDVHFLWNELGQHLSIGCYLEVCFAKLDGVGYVCLIVGLVYVLSYLSCLIYVQTNRWLSKGVWHWDCPVCLGGCTHFAVRWSWLRQCMARL